MVKQCEDGFRGGSRNGEEERERNNLSTYYILGVLSYLRIYLSKHTIPLPH